MDYAAALLEQNRAFGELIRRGDPSTPVATCPGWSLSQLFRHVGRGDRWAAEIITSGSDGTLDPRLVPDGRPPDDADDGHPRSGDASRAHPAIDGGRGRAHLQPEVFDRVTRHDRDEPVLDVAAYLGA